MGLLYDARMKVEAHIREKGLDAAQVKGTIGLKSGVVLAIVGPNTPDDPRKVERLRAAVREVLGIDL